ncbi:hypothetical protein Lal_00001728 [Lupinus albus]|uniref:Putative armadillo-like helical, pumilio domain-containing protein n=1 Tax=Lupinus albus TaxID=3870 RepID=A0A6A5P6P1_LUPAL|nr:putative armadillo-like helical, pumilio domain-containing protein [Lupinus albus]KAF1893274.1 hypothetical protein Lal_00001728 [Lupinus albus]
MSSLPLSSSVVLNEQPSLSHFLTQNHNPFHNQTDQPLEDAFALLSVSPFDFNYPNSVAAGFSTLNGTPNNHSFENPTFPTPQRSNLYDQTHDNNAVIGGGLPSLHNFWAGYETERGRVNLNNHSCGSFPASTASGCSSRNNNGFLDSEAFMMRTGFGGVLVDDQFLLRNRFNVNSGMSDQHWLNNLRGRVVLLAKDQSGRRDLISIMKRLKVTSNETSFIFLELLDHVAELMIEPFGNYVVQKLVEICTEEQRGLIILKVIQPNLTLVRICLNTYGTRSVEKLLENITSQQQRSLVMSALSPGAAILAIDANGHRVLLHCLKHFSPEDNKCLLRVVANHCFRIATDKTGCCVLKECVNYAHGEIKKRLIVEIIVNAPLLAEDAYGNYVLQHLVSPKTPIVTECLLRQLEGNFLSLSRNKYGSNVVEKFFVETGEQHKKRIILELLHHPDVARLLVDPFGNYVIRSAILGSKGAIQDTLLQLIQINSPVMQTNVYGRKLLEKFGSGRLRRS